MKLTRLKKGVKSLRFRKEVKLMIHNFIILQRISTINKTNVNRLSVHNAFSARRVPSMEQKLLILPQHSSSSPVFCVAWCQSLDHGLFLCFTFVFCISVLLQFTASNYQLCIFKLVM